MTDGLALESRRAVSPSSRELDRVETRLRTELPSETSAPAAANTPGYEASVEYVVKTLKKAGWKVSIDEFDYAYQAPSELNQLTPIAAAYESEAPAGSGAGDRRFPAAQQARLNTALPRARKGRAKDPSARPL